MLNCKLYAFTRPTHVRPDNSYGPNWNAETIDIKGMDVFDEGIEFTALNLKEALEKTASKTHHAVPEYLGTISNLHLIRCWTGGMEDTESDYFLLETL